MTTLTGLARRHPLVGFFGLAYLLSWWPWVWYRIDPAAVDAPILPFGPLIAAAIMLALIGGWPAVRAWLGGIAVWRVGPLWYALVLLLPAAITAMAVGVNLFLGAALPPEAVLPGWGDLAARFLFIFVLIGLGEEPAWRGYALPRLIEGRPALAGALILGLLHALWHLPLFGIEYDFGNVVAVARLGAVGIGGDGVDVAGDARQPAAAGAAPCGGQHDGLPVRLVRGRRGAHPVVDLGGAVGGGGGDRDHHLRPGALPAEAAADDGLGASPRRAGGGVRLLRRAPHATRQDHAVPDVAAHEDEIERTGDKLGGLNSDEPGIKRTFGRAKGEKACCGYENQHAVQRDHRHAAALGGRRRCPAPAAKAVAGGHGCDDGGDQDNHAGEDALFGKDDEGPVAPDLGNRRRRPEDQNGKEGDNSSDPVDRAHGRAGHGDLLLDSLLYIIA